MEINTPLQRAIRITDQSQPSEARRVALTLAEQLHFDEVRCGEVGIIVTEAARNILLHGLGGEVILYPRTSGAGSAMDILALDKGPGMRDVTKCLQDGYSTAGTPGTGLGAIARIASIFEVDSSPGQGTAILARLANGPDETHFQTGVVCQPVAGEFECGDAWASRHYPGRSIFALTDGLGHGCGAAEASREAIRVFEERAGEVPGAILTRMHDALKKTRGAAVSICEIDSVGGRVRYAGVGNISASIIVDGKVRSMVSHNGTLGHVASRFQEFVYPWHENALLLMHSDGLTAHWDLDRYPGLLLKHPQLIAGVMYRDYRRQRDDSCVLIAREVRHA